MFWAWKVSVGCEYEWKGCWSGFKRRRLASGCWSVRGGVQGSLHAPADSENPSISNILFARSTFWHEGIEPKKIRTRLGCEDPELRGVAPLWGLSPQPLLRNLVLPYPTAYPSNIVICLTIRTPCR